MNTGQIISGAGHVGLIAWALFGGAFRAEPLPFEVTEVTAISAEEYAALVAPHESPEAVANVDTPEPPEAGEGTPDLASVADDTPDLAQPEVAEATQPDDVPEAVEPEPLAEAEVSEEPPALQPPQEEVAALVPEISQEAQPREAPRIAPEPVAQPEPDVRVDEVEQQETQPDEAAETPQPETEAAAPEEATTEIVTEADDPSRAAPARSLRPRTRPEPAEPQEETQTAEQPQPETEDSAVDDAVAAALAQAGAAESGTPSGPPLTGGEKDALRVAVQQCWNVGSLSSEALNTTVVVSVSLGEDAKPSAGTIQMLSASGGSGEAAKQAYEAARRAIIRCGAKGFNLPIEKYDHWRDIEMTFNPEKMRIK